MLFELESITFAVLVASIFGFWYNRVSVTSFAVFPSVSIPSSLRSETELEFNGSEATAVTEFIILPESTSL